jgi:hypothetical protein
MNKLVTALTPNEPQPQNQTQQSVPQQYVPQGTGYADQGNQQRYSLNN